MFSESFRCGKQHPDTVYFSDEDIFSQYGGKPHKIQQIVIAHSGNNVLGLQAVYNLTGTNQAIKGKENFGREVGSNAKFETINFNDDEYLIEIFGRHGDIYDRIGFRTSTGNSYEFGGFGGNPFTIKAPSGKHFNILRGGLGGHIHFTDCLVASIPQMGYQGYPTSHYPISQSYPTNQSQGYQGSQSVSGQISQNISYNDDQDFGLRGQGYQPRKFA